MRRALLTYTSACAALAALAYVLAFGSGRGLGWDEDVFTAATTDRDVPSVRAASRGLIDTIDIGSLALLGGGLIAIALLLRRPRAALAAAAVLAGANIATYVLKHGLARLHPFGRPRPLLNATFPSGHATVAMSIALAAVLVAPQTWKLVVALIGGAYAAGVGIAVLVQGGHYASDVAAGYLVAGACAGAVAALLRPSAAEPPRSLRPALALASALVAAFAVAVAVAVHEDPGIVVAVRLQTKVAFALVLLAALALATAGALALLLQASAARSASTTRS